MLSANWQILCDFDGTIVTDDVTDRLLERFASSSWKVLERDWLEGRIGSMQCMRDQIALLNAVPAMLDSEIARTAVDPTFPEFIAAARRLEIPVTIVSDGLDRVIRDVLRRAGLADIDIRASQLNYASDGQWRLEFPEAMPDCRSGSGTCKCAVAKETRRRKLLIGDGRSDFCVAQAADFVFAKDKLLVHCREHLIPHEAFADFAEAEMLLKLLVQRQLIDPALEPAIYG